jgi:hypothetical protein
MRPSLARPERPHRLGGLRFRNYGDADIINVVTAAAAQERSIDTVCKLIPIRSDCAVRNLSGRRCSDQTA